jgi:hypothetical protein
MPQPVTWSTAVRAWLLVYVAATLGMAGIFRVTETLMGGGVHDAAEGFAPLIGAAVFMGAVGGGMRPGRSTARSVSGRVHNGTGAMVIAWVTLFVAAIIADMWVHQPSGWASFMVSVGLSTLACGVFVALTHLQLDRPRPGPTGTDRRR